MLRVVLDTNVLISALIGEGNEYEFVKKCVQGKFVLVTSPEILDEFKEVALRPRLGIAAEDVADFIGSLVEVSEVVLPTEKVSFARDPNDEKILEAAVEAKSDYIVSGDKDLLSLRSFRSIMIVTAAELLQNPNRANATRRQEPKKRGDVRNI